MEVIFHEKDRLPNLNLKDFRTRSTTLGDIAIIEDIIIEHKPSLCSVIISSIMENPGCDPELALIMSGDPDRCFHRSTTNEYKILQEGSLCAQHCLNVLLQGEYFTAVDLASLAQGLDDAERQHMAEGGVHSEEYRRFLQQPSTNMDDSGYFSVQVIASALKVWNLELIPFNSQNPIALMAKENPLCQGAFICNYKDHWFTVRKLGQQWFNLNSLLSGPELISDTYLIMFLAQLEQEGYSIFVVLGELPECEADSVLKHTRVTQTTKPVLLSDASTSKQQSLVTSSRSCESQRPDVFDEDLIIQEALRRSLQDSVPSSSEPYAEVSSTIHTVQGSYSSDLPRSKNPDCLKAEGESLDSVKGDAESEVTASSDAIAALSNSNGLTEENENGDYMTEEEMLEVAIKMSMDPS